MKSIRREIKKNYTILILCACVFIMSNISIYIVFAWQDNTLLKDYEQINQLVISNNQRKTSFKLYCKSKEDYLLQDYYDNCGQLNQSLSKMSEKMQHDNNCKMMYRIVCQVVEHSYKVAEQYTRPTSIQNSGIVNYLDEVDLELERCMNQLINHYLEYLNQTFAQRSERMKIIMLSTNLGLIFGCLCLIKQNHEISHEVLKSIEKLSEATKEIINKNFEANDIRKMNYIELNQVSETFDHMKHRIRDMIIEINETHQMKEHLAEAKIRELQMQMNPHFLFNSLSLVVRHIQLDEKDTSIQLIHSISRILRSSIEIKSLAIPLDDEIDLLQAYLYIQKLHLRGRVSFYLDVRKSFVDKEYKIPPLTIQPLVENSVQHGLKDKIKDGKVEIMITEKTDHIEVVVADNGIGFQNQGGKVEYILGNRKSISKTSIGFHNVWERLKLYYRKNDVMKVERIDDITKITLKLYKTRDT